MAIYTDRFTVLRAPLVDDVYGSVRDWVNAREMGSHRASVQPEAVGSGGAADEDRDRETTITTYRVFVPGGADVTSADRIRWRGLLYDVVGAPRVWTLPAQSRHVVFVMRRVDG